MTDAWSGLPNGFGQDRASPPARLKRHVTDDSRSAHVGHCLGLSVFDGSQANFSRHRQRDHAVSKVEFQLPE